MEVMLERCCGLDLHKDTIVACLMTGTAIENPEVERRAFGTMYDDLVMLVAWLKTNECPYVAMESTGSYWMPIFNLLTDAGVQCVLANPKYVKNLPGRKTDWNDAHWIAYLFRYGMIRNSFVPGREQQFLRSHTRSLESLTEDRTREKNRIEKLLQAEGFKLSSVLEDIFGITGRHFLDILAQKGSLSFKDIERYRNQNCKMSSEAIFKAVKGTLPPQICKLLAFKLRQIDHYNTQIAELEALIDDLIAPSQQAVELIDSIPGIARHAAIDIVAEIGTNMDIFQSAEHLASWAGLSPRSNKSAGKKVYTHHARKQTPQESTKPMCLELLKSKKRPCPPCLVLDCCQTYRQTKSYCSLVS